MGALVATAPVKVPFQWNGAQYDIEIKQLSYTGMMRYVEDGATPLALVKQTVILDGQLITDEQAERLTVPMVQAMAKASFEVNGLGKEAEGKAGDKAGDKADGKAEGKAEAKN